MRRRTNERREAVGLRGIVSACGLMVIGVMVLQMAAQEAGQKTFATPEDASKGLYDQAKTMDKNGMLSSFGSSAAELVSSGDEVADNNEGAKFVERYDQMHRWDQQTDGSMVLLLGAENWPFPIPLKKNASGQWYFDTKVGAQEILFRRIGKNEIAAIRVLGALVDAQNEYFNQAHDGDTTKQYAQKILSDEGKRNGLYWKATEGQPESPVGPLVAFATGEGYGGQHGDQPFHGYFYRALKGQGANAKGGAKSYVVDGKMTQGFAFVAYPAVYRVSGVTTFLIDQDGVVYEKDLGPQTADLAKAMNAYNPDKTWFTAEVPQAATASVPTDDRQ